jgi:hypothetical protein
MELWEGVWHWPQGEICYKSTDFLLLVIMLQGEDISTYQESIMIVGRLDHEDDHLKRSVAKYRE